MVKLSGSSWLEYLTYVRERSAGRHGEELRRFYIEAFGQSDALQHLDTIPFWAVFDVLLDTDHGTAPYKWVEQWHRECATIAALQNAMN